MAFSVAYTTSSFPASLNGDADIKAHDDLMSSKLLGLVNPLGSVLRHVDFAPGYQCVTHRTQSIDYGIVLEGTIGEIEKINAQVEIACSQLLQRWCSKIHQKR